MTSSDPYRVAPPPPEFADVPRTSLRRRLALLLDRERGHKVALRFWVNRRRAVLRMHERGDHSRCKEWRHSWPMPCLGVPLTEMQFAAISTGRCADCHGRLAEGPHGGAAVNVICRLCGARFNVMPGPFGIERVPDWARKLDVYVGRIEVHMGEDFLHVRRR